MSWTCAKARNYFSVWFKRSYKSYTNRAASVKLLKSRSTLEFFADSQCGCLATCLARCVVKQLTQNKIQSSKGGTPSWGRCNLRAKLVMQPKFKGPCLEVRVLLNTGGIAPINVSSTGVPKLVILVEQMLKKNITTHSWTPLQDNEDKLYIIRVLSYVYKNV